MIISCVIGIRFRNIIVFSVLRRDDILLLIIPFIAFGSLFFRFPVFTITISIIFNLFYKIIISIQSYFIYSMYIITINKIYIDTRWSILTNIISLGRIIISLLLGLIIFFILNLYFLAIILSLGSWFSFLPCLLGLLFLSSTIIVFR